MYDLSSVRTARHPWRRVERAMVYTAVVMVIPLIVRLFGIVMEVALDLPMDQPYSPPGANAW